MIKRRSLIKALIALVCSATQIAIAQTLPSTSKFADIDFSVGDAEGSLALSFNYDKGLGDKKKIIVGFGGRFTAYLGKNQYYLTAPAKLTSGSTGLGVIFKENIVANMDTFLIKNAQVNSLNLFVTLGYNLSEKLMLRFNIDSTRLAFRSERTQAAITSMERKDPLNQQVQHRSIYC